MAGKAGEPRVPLTLQHSRLKAEEKTLDFEFELLGAQFNQQGCYTLRLTVENPLLQGSGTGVRLRINSGEVTQSSTGSTDTVEQSNLGQTSSFQRRKFTFTLPRGFCKNDKNHDVRLHIEALRFPGREERMRRSRLVGEAFFAIYPRPNQPRMKLSAGRDEDWYRYSSVMALLRVGSEQPAMHCGRLAFTASLHEHRPPTTLPSPPPLFPSTQEEDQQAAGTAPTSASPSLGIPVPRRSFHTPESAYHSLPTEGQTHSPERLQAVLSSSPELAGDSADEHPSSSSSSSVPAPRRLLSRSSFHLSSPGYSADLASSPGQVSESPAGTEEPRHAVGAGEGHVARVGKEAITVTLHGASNLPATREGRVPWPYVIVKTSRGDEQKAGATRPSSVPTHTPTWEEEVTVELDAEDAGWAALTLTVADKATKEALGTFQLPVRHLQPFQPHHCRLVLPRTREPAGMALNVTIIRKGSFIPRCHGLSYVALEVLLRGLSAPLATPPGALVAVARVVSNVQEYKHRMEKHPITWPTINPTTIPFPDPPAAAFSIARAPSRGCPQMSRPAGPPEQPTWDTSFLFQGQDVATIFSEDTALVIEYYPSEAMWDAPGTLVPVGYSVLPLTSRVFRELAAQSGGLRVDGLAVQGTDLRTTSGAIPTVGLCLQLLRSERPAAFLTPSGSDALPSLDPAGVLERGEELRAAPMRPFHCQLHRANVSLPAADAVASILPGKQLFPRGTGVLAEEQRSQEIIGDHQEPVSDEETRGEGDIGALGGQHQAAVGSTLPEVGSYRLALKRMAGDLLSLRQHVTSLEVENRHLRHSLASQEELGHTLLADVDLDVMTREELLDRLATLKRKLVAGTVEMRRLKDHVQQLQNELIRKNDREKDLVLLQRAHRQQQAVLRRCQEKLAKMKGLEKTVRQQEKVIEAMERMLQEKLAGVGRSTQKPVGEALSGEVYTALLTENHRLREELARPPHASPPIAPRPPALLGGFGGTEKLSLLARLEEAQARGRVLEKQPAWFGSVPAGEGGEEVGTGEAGAGHSSAGAGARLPPRPRHDPHGPPEKTPTPDPPPLARRTEEPHAGEKKSVLFHVMKLQERTGGEAKR
ncbi:coiled-coil domain-containing protein 33 [Nyctibius grandis]|uniref:coiled-coil domain-containing protein 33 n=1 Tax=Nyctibius grandis TaxID=48427 RepID=UPI0035BBB3BF